MDVIIRNITQHCDNISAYELVHQDGLELAKFSAGAHIDVKLANGLIRQYSIANCSSEQNRYVIGVLKDENSRGGSHYIHENFKIGDHIEISEPRNLFPIHPETQKAILFAGGIGITPIYAMAQELLAQDIEFELHYFARSQNALAFKNDLDAKFKNQLHFHLDEQTESKADMQDILKNPHNNTHLYVCGPNGFMNYVIQSAVESQWYSAQIHQEHFVAEQIDSSEDKAFSIEIKSTGQKIRVEANQTALSALETNGISIPVSCEQGICGTCLTSVLSGEPDHRDLFLTEEEQAENKLFAPCCSRSKSEILVLDL
ncbi:PDR/VanB family oxidoreductase [Acinetobacter gerneri]|uniref:PDR/VanB family oxidoreductase n=1 Tax=Acinetobacter gerneri TaxID=202952 RepID=UPI0032152DD0